MADETFDPTGEQDKKNQLITAPNYLGKPVSIPYSGAEGIEAGAASGSLPAPGGPGGLATSGGMVSGGQASMGGEPTPGGDVMALLGMGRKGYNALSSLFGTDLGVRGDVGGPGTPQGQNQSLADILRSQDLTAPTTGGIIPGITSTGLSGSEASAAALAEHGPAGITDFPFTGSELSQALEAELGAAGGGGLLSGGLSELLAGLGGAGAIGVTAGSLWPIIQSFFQGDEAFNFFGPFGGPTSRVPSIAHEISTEMRDLPTIFDRLKKGAIDPSTMAGMSPEDLQNALRLAKEGYASSGELSDFFGKSGRKEEGLTHPDLSGLIGPTHQLEGLDFYDMIRAQDLMAQRGIQPNPDFGFYGQPVSFPEALQALGTASNGLPGYGPEQLTALSPWLPNFKDSPIVSDQDYPGGFRPARSPQEYLSAIGADPALADTLGPLITGAQPGQYLDTAAQIFGQLDPAFGQSLFAELQGGTPAAPESPVPPGITPAGLIAATNAEPGTLDTGAGAGSSAPFLKEPEGLG